MAKHDSEIPETRGDHAVVRFRVVEAVWVLEILLLELVCEPAKLVDILNRGTIIGANEDHCLTKHLSTEAEISSSLVAFVGLLDCFSFSVSEFEEASKLATVSDDFKLGEIEVWLEM